MDKSIRFLGAVAAIVVCAGSAGAAQAYAYWADPAQARSSIDDRIQQANFFYPDPSLYYDDPWVVRPYHPPKYHYQYRDRHHDHRAHHRSHRGVEGTGSSPAAK